MASGTDIILGVARAADTAKQRIAASRLERLSQPVATQPAATDPAVASWQPAEQMSEPASEWSSEVRVANANTPRTARFLSSPKPTSESDKKSEVYVQFESVLLQNMVEAMMPTDAEALYGKGTAGQIWKSMMAEKIAAEIARSGAVGIAKMIEAGPTAASAGPRSTKSKVDET